jgi:hypothetical protein
VLVIDSDGTVSVQFDPWKMQEIQEQTNTWVQHLKDNPAKLERHIWRGQLNPSDPNLWNTIMKRCQRGFMGERAVAKYVGATYEWRLLEAGRDETDVDGIQVRTVDNFRKRLITHEYDRPAPYVLAVADWDTATVVLRGWLHLRHCNVREHWWATQRAPAFFTPATELHPMRTLRQHYNDRKRRLNNGV